MKLRFAALFWLGLGLGQARAEGLGPSILHVPSSEQRVDQGILTPVPISLEVPPDLPVRRALVHYKVHGAPEWRTLELLRDGARYTGAIPCLEVSTITGDLLYYIRLHDAEGAVIAQSGTRNAPYRVVVHHESERPDLVGERARCPDPADCPPGLPGCPSAEVERIPCRTDADCEGAESCGWDGFCGQDPRRRNWLSVELEQGLGVVPTTGACSVESQENEGYACFRETDGAAYVGNPVYTNEPLRAGLAPTRVLIGYERVLFYDTSVGVRVGYAFLGSGRTPRGGAGFVPFSAEVHAKHWFGGDPFARPAPRFYGLLGAGFAQFDVHVKAHVREDPTRANVQGGNDLEQTLDVWKRAGDGFVVLGFGAAVPVSEAFSPFAELRGYQVFPFGATIVSGALGVSVGF